MHDQLENFVNDRREEFDSLNPNPDILNRIQAKMGGTKEINEPSSTVYRLPSTIYRWVAAAVVILLAGVGVYKTIDRRPETVKSSMVNSQGSVASKKSYELRDTSYELQVPVNNQPKSQRNQVRVGSVEESNSETRSPNLASRNSSSVSGLSSTVSLRLKNMESASDRYAAVSEIMEMKKVDRDIIEVLVKTMNNDPNSNVRLAALESLGKYYREPYVKKQLVAAMSKQKDPVVQIALIEMLTKFRNTSIVNELKKIAEDGNTTKPVKDQAYSSLLKYSL